MLNLHFRGLLASAVWTEGQFWSTVVGRARAVKLATVTHMNRAQRVNALLGILLIIAAVRLTRG